jgi:hypothetical protein
MMSCTKCNFSTDTEGARFCLKCGAPLEQVLSKDTLSYDPIADHLLEPFTTLRLDNGGYVILSVKPDDTSEHIRIPEGVVSIADGAFAGKGIKSLTLPKSLTNIGKGAFRLCKELDTVYGLFGNELKIGEEAFALCPKLESVTVASYGSVLGKRCFYHTGLKKAALVGSFVIGEEAFDNCGELKKIEISTAVTEIGASAFLGCSALCEVCFTEAQHDPEAKLKLGDSAFRGCKRMYSINLPDNLVKIGADCFKGCMALPGISLPQSLKRVGADAFLLTGSDPDILNTCALKSVHIDSASAWAEIEFENKYSTPLSFGATLFLHGNPVNQIVLECESVGKYAFTGCKCLERVTLGEGVTSIGEEAFSYSALQDISLPSTLKSIGNGAFLACRTLFYHGQMDLPRGVEFIGNYAFAECTGIRTVYLPEALSTLGQGAFRGCEMLTGVYFGSPLKTLPYRCFLGCHIQSLVLPEGMEEIEHGALARCNALDTVFLPSTLKSISAFMLQDCERAPTVHYPATRDEWSKKVTVTDGSLLTKRTARIKNAKMVFQK